MPSSATHLLLEPNRKAPPIIDLRSQTARTALVAARAQQLEIPDDLREAEARVDLLQRLVDVAADAGQDLGSVPAAELEVALQKAADAETRHGALIAASERLQPESFNRFVALTAVAINGWCDGLADRFDEALSTLKANPDAPTSINAWTNEAGVQAFQTVSRAVETLEHLLQTRVAFGQVAGEQGANDRNMLLVALPPAPPANHVQFNLAWPKLAQYIRTTYPSFPYGRDRWQALIETGYSVNLATPVQFAERKAAFQTWAELAGMLNATYGGGHQFNVMLQDHINDRGWGAPTATVGS